MPETRTTTEALLGEEEVRLLNAYWRAANYLSVAQIYLLDNPLLREPLKPEHVKPRLLGHFGTVPGLNLLYAHLNRQIRAHDLDAIYITGPGHGGPALVANSYLEGTYSELYPNISGDEAGLKKLFRQFSFPGGIPSHVAPEVPGSIHEGGELGYALVHAFGAAFDNPDLLVACVVGDGEAETGPLAASWHSNKFLNPTHRRRRPARAASERLQDRQPDRARTDPGSGAHRPLRGLRLAAAPRHRRVRRRGPSARPRALRRHPRRGTRGDPRDSAAGARGWGGDAAHLADVDPAHTQGVDRAEGGRRQEDRGQLALAPGADGIRAGQRCPHAPARGVAEELPAGGALRRRRSSRLRACGACAGGREADEREPARERRRADA